MQFENIINVMLSILIVVIPATINLFRIGRHSIHSRLALLGFSVAAAIIVYSLRFFGYTDMGLLYNVILFSLFWYTGFFFLSFLMDMTSVRRPGWFFIMYSVPLFLGIVSSLEVSRIWIVITIILGLSGVFFFTLTFTLSWIRAATDDRARRDGEWMLMVFVAFAIGLVVCLFRTTTGLFWVVSIWFLVLHIAVNGLKILQQLTGLENLLIIDNVFDVVMILDSAGRIVRINRRGVSIAACSAGAINGNGIETVIHHRDLCASKRIEWLEQHGWIDHGYGNDPGETRSPSIDAMFVTAKDEMIPVDLRILCLTGPAKQRTGYIISATDMRITHQLMKEISDREYAARDLALSESKFSRMFIFNPVGIVIVDLDTLRITETNPASEDIFECDGSMLAGKTLSAIGLDMIDISYEAFFEKLMMEGSVPEFSARIRISPQQVKKCRLSAVTFDLNQMRNMLLSVSDVTQQEQMREALERKQKVETVGILAGGIAHDFNNILAVILGHVGLAKMRIIDDHARAPVLKAEEACLRAREMTRQLLAFSRGGKPVLGVCKARQLFTDAAMLAVEDTSVACLFNIDKDIWPLIADKIQIGQVVTNLVSNAVAAMNGSGIIEIQAKNRDFRSTGFQKRPKGFDSKPLAEGTYVELRVIDQGPGIPESIKEKIFDPFFTTKEKGTGLGLSIVYSVVQNHGGAIRVISREGDGSTFCVFLPADSETQVVEGNSGHVSLAGNKKVLLMDDDVHVRETASGILEAFGYNVTSTESGEDAVISYREALASGKPYDFCVLDLVVPGGMSGSVCAKEILSCNPDAVLFVSSGYSDDPVLANYRQYGFRGVIPKPYTFEELQATLANVLVL